MRYRIHMLLVESSGIKTVSKQKAIDYGMFGPVYHGTTGQNFEKIVNQGFDVRIGEFGDEGVSHGFSKQAEFNGLIPPVHFLGYGAYFTTVKNIAKAFAYGNTKVLKEFYLDVPRLETINFGSPNTMMKWWIKMGYPAQAVKDGEMSRLEATKILTDNLKNEYDAVWFRGKGLHRLLDGDQICVFDPSRIYMIDTAVFNDFDIGSKVRRKRDGMIGTIVKKFIINQQHIEWSKDHMPFYQQMIEKIESGDDTPIKEWSKYSHREITPEVREEALMWLKHIVEGIEGMFEHEDYTEYYVKWNKGGTQNERRGNIEPYRGKTKS
jgi:hypothetical protein